MKFLIDTNILIALEPTSERDVEVNTDLANKFHLLVNSSGNEIFVHPDIHYDIARDTDQERASLRRTFLQRYNEIPAPPAVDILDDSLVEGTEEGANDWVDNKLIAALQAEAVDYLITEDTDIHKKGIRLNLQERILELIDAVEMLRGLFDQTPTPPPAVEDVVCHELDESDPIFNSLREDYQGFDAWLASTLSDI